MTDYIRRDTLIEDIDEAVKHRGMGEIIGQTLRRYILRQPAADVAPVVHGEWSDNGIAGSVLLKCSVCGFDCGASSFFYCPKCGAKMDGGEKDG